MIPNNIDILITHGPPYDILDETRRGVSVGCPILREHVLHRINPALHFFGHIHEMGGMEQRVENHKTRFFNCSVVDLKYRPINDVINIEI